MFVDLRDNVRMPQWCSACRGWTYSPRWGKGCDCFGWCSNEDCVRSWWSKKTSWDARHEPNTKAQKVKVDVQKKILPPPPPPPAEAEETHETAESIMEAEEITEDKGPT